MYSFYRGTTFQFIGQVQDDGIVQDLTNATFQARVSDETGDNVYGNPIVTVVAPATAGIVQVSYTGNTLIWPVGKARIDFIANLPNNPNPIASGPTYFRILQNPILG